MSIADDILRKKREFEAEPPTLDEIAEKTAQSYRLNRNFKESAIDLRNEESLDEFLKKVAQQTSKSSPEKDEKFLQCIPKMHRSWSAMEEISRNSHMAKMYALVMTKIYEGNIPFEIEKIITVLDETELISQLKSAGLNWSPRAQRLIEKFHPKMYDRLFTECHQPTGFTL